MTKESLYALQASVDDIRRESYIILISPNPIFIYGLFNGFPTSNKPKF